MLKQIPASLILRRIIIFHRISKNLWVFYVVMHLSQVQVHDSGSFKYQGFFSGNGLEKSATSYNHCTTKSSDTNDYCHLHSLGFDLFFNLSLTSINCIQPSLITLKFFVLHV